MSTIKKTNQVSTEDSIVDFPIKRLYVLSLVGLLFSIVLSNLHTEIKFGFQEAPSSCSINDYIDCDTVTKSSYSDIGGIISVAALAAFYYLVLIGLLHNWKTLSSAVATRAIFSLSALGLLGTLLMMCLSFTVIRSFCLWCSVLWVDNIVMFFIILKALRKIHKRFLPIEFFSGLVNLAIIISPSFGFKSFIKAKDDKYDSLGVLTVHFLLSLFFAFSLSSVIVFWTLIPTYVRYGLSNIIKRDKINNNTTDLKARREVFLNQWKQMPARKIPIDLSDGDDRDFHIGKDDAPITIVDFSDFECPMCRKASKELEELEKNYTGKIRIVFKNYPLDQSCNTKILRPMHKFSCKAAAMARCAGNFSDTAYLSMHRAIYQLNEISEDSLSALVNKSDFLSSKADKDMFWSCVSNPSTVIRIKRDIELGDDLDIKGTPAVFVNGIFVDNPFNGNLTTIMRDLTE